MNEAANVLLQSLQHRIQTWKRHSHPIGVLTGWAIGGLTCYIVAGRRAWVLFLVLPHEVEVLWQLLTVHPVV